MSVPGLPASSVLARVKALLPQLQQAQEALETRIRYEGAESVRIDVGLASSAAAEEEEEGADDDSGDNSDEEDGEGEGEDASEGSGLKDAISLEFALGDFDDSLIAKLEDEKQCLGDSRSEGDGGN